MAGKNTLTRLVSDIKGSPKPVFKYYSPYVVTYSKRTQGGLYLSANFKVSEFACKDGNDTVKIDLALVERLQAIRNHFGKAVVIVSGYRTPVYNRLIGGAPASQHLYGCAADISIAGISRSQIRAYANSIGLSCEIYNSDYPNTAGLTQHVDTRNIAYPGNFHE